MKSQHDCGNPICKDCHPEDCKTAFFRCKWCGDIVKKVIDIRMDSLEAAVRINTMLDIGIGHHCHGDLDRFGRLEYLGYRQYDKAIDEEKEEDKGSQYQFPNEDRGDKDEHAKEAT